MKEPETEFLKRIAAAQREGVRRGEIDEVTKPINIAESLERDLKAARLLRGQSRPATAVQRALDLLEEAKGVAAENLILASDVFFDDWRRNRARIAGLLKMYAPLLALQTETTKLPHRRRSKAREAHEGAALRCLNLLDELEQLLDEGDGRRA